MMSDIERGPAIDELSLFADAKCADLCLLAQQILDEIGSDHSVDDDPLLEADWEAEELHRKFLLQREGGPASATYWLHVTSTSDDYDDERIGFDRRASSLTCGVDDDDPEDVFLDNDPDFWHELEADLQTFLRSARGVNFKLPKVDARWNDVFDQMMRDPDPVQDIPDQEEPSTAQIPVGSRQERMELAAHDKDILYVAKLLLDNATMSTELADWCSQLCADARQLYELDVDDLVEALERSILKLRHKEPHGHEA